MALNNDFNTLTFQSKETVTHNKKKPKNKNAEKNLKQNQLSIFLSENKNQQQAHESEKAIFISSNNRHSHI